MTAATSGARSTPPLTRAADATEPELVGVAALLRTLGREIGGLERLARDLQAVPGLLAGGCGPDHRAIERWQGLDLLAQRLQGIDAFLGALAPGLPAAWRCDAAAAARAVTLSDLARQLGSPGRDAERATEAGAGEAEFFEAGGE